MQGKEGVPEDEDLGDLGRRRGGVGGEEFASSVAMNGRPGRGEDVIAVYGQARDRRWRRRSYRIVRQVIDIPVSVCNLAA
jgi:hypothetical protein